MFITDEEAAVV